MVYMVNNLVTSLLVMMMMMMMSSAWVTRLECPKGVKDEVKQARRAKRVAEGHQLEIGAQRAPRFLVCYNFEKQGIQGYQISHVLAFGKILQKTYAKGHFLKKVIF